MSHREGTESVQDRGAHGGRNSSKNEAMGLKEPGKYPPELDMKWGVPGQGFPLKPYPKVNKKA